MILLDVFMPGIDGLQTAALVRGREKLRDIPIIFITAESTGRALLAEGYSLGAVDYILKPVEPEILKSKVAVFVELFRKTEEVKRQAALLHEKNIELENANMQRLGKLIELGQQLSAEREPDNLLEKFARAAQAIVGAKYAAVGVLDEMGRTSQLFCTKDARVITNNASADLPDTSRGILKVLAASRHPLRLSDIRTETESLEFLTPLPHVKSFLAAPVVSPSRIFGWLYLADKTDAREFGEADERILVTAASQFCVAYENARLYAEAQKRSAELAQEVAERKQAEEERARLLVREQAARAEAEAANRLKDEFLTTVSHELRTPLTAILGWAAMLRRDGMKEHERNQALDVIIRNGLAQKQLIEDLLDASRIITGKLALDMREVDLTEIAEATCETVRPSAEAKNLQLFKRFSDKPLFVKGDPDRLQQVIWNLLSNAVKFTPAKGRIEISVAAQDGRALVCVSDSGQGIAQEFLPFVFDRFRQADGTTTRRHGGLGLGLSIVRHLAELHGGGVRAESEGEGCGARFFFELPLARIKSAAKKDGARASLYRDASSMDGHAETALSGIHALIVEDEADSREWLRLVLEQHGASVTVASSAKSALEAFRMSKPDLIISDVGMPEEDGYTFIKNIRDAERPHGVKTPALALTAYAAKSDRQRAIDSGYDEHVTKPPAVGHFISTVARLTGRQTAE